MPVVAGSQAEGLVKARGFGRAIPLWPDARRFALLSPEAIGPDISPIYGRPPDAKIAGTAQ